MSWVLIWWRVWCGVGFDVLVCYGFFVSWAVMFWVWYDIGLPRLVVCLRFGGFASWLCVACGGWL